MKDRIMIAQVLFLNFSLSLAAFATVIFASKRSVLRVSFNARFSAIMNFIAC